jgi:ketosteroid isomerase-like protein
MSNQDSLNVVQQVYNDFKNGDVPALLAKMDSSIQWEVPHIPNARISGRRQGRERVQEFFSILATDQDVVRFEPRKFVAQGDTVVALGDYEWRVKATGKAFKSDFAHVFTVRDGHVTGFHEFMDSSAATEAYRK